MHTLSMIDMGTKAADIVVTAKASSKNEQQFGKVLNESSHDNQAVTYNHITETKQQSKAQRPLIDRSETVTQDELSENIENSGIIPMLLSNSEQQSELTELPGEQVLDAGATPNGAVGGIDPRFAGLLNPRTENCSARQVQSHSLRQQVEQNQGESAVPVFPEEMSEQKQSGELSQRPNGSAKQVLDNLAQLESRNLQPQGHLPVQGLEANKALASSPVVQLTSGQQVPESQIFDQVVTQISGSVNGESGRMVLRLQPAELGSLKIELIVEGDRVRANLHAQTQQVQEVLERNLPQLRNALIEQGLKIDQFLVSVDKDHDQQGQFENLQQQNNSSEKQPNWHKDPELEEHIIPLAHLMQNGGGGISLHV